MEILIKNGKQSGILLFGDPSIISAISAFGCINNATQIVRGTHKHIMFHIVDIDMAI